MSYIGQEPILIPTGVTIDFNLHIPIEILLVVKDSTLLVYPHHLLLAALQNHSIPSSNAAWGTTRSIIFNIIQSTLFGSSKQIILTGSGFSVDIQNLTKGPTLVFNFARLHNSYLPIPPHLTVTISGIHILIQGVDIIQVTNFAATIKSLYKTNLYSGKGLLYPNEVVTLKVGKKK